MTPRVKNEYPIELTAPDISAYKNGNTGIDYFTLGYEDQQGFSTTFMEYLTRTANGLIEKYNLNNTTLSEAIEHSQKWLSKEIAKENIEDIDNVCKIHCVFNLGVEKNYE